MVISLFNNNFLFGLKFLKLNQLLINVFYLFGIINYQFLLLSFFVTKSYFIEYPNISTLERALSFNVMKA